MKSFAAFVLAALLAPAAHAIALSHGIQLLPITLQECMQRGSAALQAEGFGSPAPTPLMAGFKGPHGVYLYCGSRPDGVTSVNIFVASEGTGDGNVPGAERVRLQDRMAVAAPPPPPPPPPGGCSGFAGSWNMSAFGIATLGVDAAGRVSGGYTNGGGRIEATVAGDVLTGTWTQPGRSGGLQARLNPGGQSFSCEWSEGGRVAGGCNASCRGPAQPLIYDIDRGASFAGEWETGYGTVVLLVSGSQVTGSYTRPPGRIEGTLSGNVLEGRWIQADRWGRMRLQLAADGRSFNGTWTESSGRGGGVWNGTRR